MHGYSEYVNGSLILCTAFEERDIHRFLIFFLKLPRSVTPIRSAYIV